MADGIRLDLQEALARGPSGIPNLEPLFAPGAIPPIFDEAPELDEGAFIPSGGIPPSGATATFPGEPIDLGNAPIGSPVPPVKASRGERLRRLLGNFLQNFGEGLQAASRAPSGAEFAAGLGAALSEPEARRQQQVFENLSRANQALKRQIAAENAAFRQADLDAEERTRQAGRIERQGVRAVAGRRRFEDILTAGRQRTADILRERKQREEDKAFIREQGGTEFLRRLRLKRTPSGGRSGATKFPEAERKRLSESIALQLGIELPGTSVTGGLSPTGSFQFMLKLSRIGTVIDALARQGADQNQILRTFGLATARLKIEKGRDPTPEEVLELVIEKLSQ